MNNSYCAIPTTLDNILNHIEGSQRNSSGKQFSDEELLTLHSVFGIILQRALDILEKYPLLEIYTTADKSRTLLEVKGENDRCYRIFPRINFCPCLAFKHQVLEQKSQVTCKHILAGRLAIILEKTKEHEVTLEQYQMLVRSMFEFV